MPDVKPAEVTSRAPLVDFTREDANPPAPVYISRDDRLYLRSASLVSTRDLLISGRLLHADGVIRPFTFRKTAPAATPTVQLDQLAEGFLLSLVVSVVTAATPAGLVFTEIGLLRGRGADFQTSQVLISGYPSSSSSLGWPGGVQRQADEGLGRIVGSLLADPVAGAEWTVTVTTDTRRVVAAVRFQLVTDATVANRFPRVEFVSGGATIWRSLPMDAQVASTTRDYNYSIGVDYLTTPQQNEYQNQMPELILSQGTIVRSSTVGIVAGDNYGAPAMYHREWFED